MYIYIFFYRNRLSIWKLEYILNRIVNSYSIIYIVYSITVIANRVSSIEVMSSANFYQGWEICLGHKQSDWPHCVDSVVSLIMSMDFPIGRGLSLLFATNKTEWIALKRNKLKPKAAFVGLWILNTRGSGGGADETRVDR